MGLEIHCINSGQGNSSALKLPDDSFMIVDIDCSGDTPIDPVSYLKELVPEEYDAKEGRNVRRLSCAAFTHPHDDHISGLKPLVDNGFVFDEIWESGHRLSADDAEDNDAYDDYIEILDECKEEGKVKTPQASQNKWREDFHGVDVYCLGPSKHLNADDAEDTNRDAIHNRCLILSIISDEMSILLTGDSTLNQWNKRIRENYSEELLEADVLVASHHGSRTFFKENKEDDPHVEAIEAISPDYTLISVGKDNGYDHPHKDALKLYQDYTGGAVAQTKDEGSILVKKIDGEISLEPSSVDAQVKDSAAMKSLAMSLARTPKVSISAQEFHKSTKRPIRSLKSGKSKVVKDSYILFRAKIEDRPPGTEIEWAVKNLGVDDDSHHDEYYLRGDVSGRFDYDISREDSEAEWTRLTSFTGRHICIARLIDSLNRRTLASTRFIVHVDKPRSRYRRKLGRRR